MDLFVILVAIVVLASVVLILWKRQRGGLKPVPGPRAWPILGNAHQIKPTRLQVTLFEWMQTYGDIFQFTLLGEKYVVLNSSELIQSELHKFVNRPFNIQNEINYEGNGPTFNNSTFFIHKVKQGVIDVAQDKTRTELSEEQIKDLIDTFKESGGRDIPINMIIKRMVTSQMIIALIGCKPTDADIKVVLNYLEDLRDLFAGGAVFVLTTYPWVKSIPGTLFKRLYYSNKAAIAEMVKELTRTDRQRERNFPGLIAQLEKRTSGETEEEILTDMNINGAIVDAIAGSVVPWFAFITGGILCLAKHSSVQEKIHSEMDNICQNECPNIADRDKLPYLSATVVEIFRYLSFLTTTLPHVATEDTEINGFFVEKDTTILGGIFNLHHSEAIWNDPWTFRPERFIDESGNLQSSKHILPFSTGPRMCKGYRLAEPGVFTCLANILYHFVILPPTSGDLPDHDPKTFSYGAALILPPIHCRFEPRVSK